MRRTKRHLLRLYFILVITVGLFGGWFVRRTVEVEPSTIEEVNFSQDMDWIEIVSALGEGAIQIFFGFTSSE